MVRQAGLVWVGVVVGVLSSCSSGSEPVTDASSTSTVMPRASTATDAAATAGTVGSSAIAVVLGPDRLVVGGNALVFGAPRRQVRAYLDRALGKPTASAEAECGPGPLETDTWPGITTYVAEEGFAGWTAQGPTFATDRGVRVGSRQAAVEVAYPSATVAESSLGTEFFAPGPSEGVGLSGVYEDGAVADLWSGATCVAR